MLHPRPRCTVLAYIPRLVVISALGAAVFGSPATAQVLVGDPFITSYQNWIDAVPGRNGNWRLSLNNPTIMETSDVVPGGTNPPAAENNGSYNPQLLIQDAFTSPSNYDLSARMYSSDDDGFGLVFGYQNPDNYFRAFLRWQSPGNLGGTPGVSVQKVVNGVATQISPMGTGPGNQLAPTVEQITNREPIDVRVAVNGQNYDVYVVGINNDMPLASGTDPDLMPGKIGIQSWAQRVGPAATFGRVPHWGTEVETISVMQGANTLFSGNFNGLPVRWRQVVMTNAAGISTLTTVEGEDIGNFGADINDNWIYQQTNGFENATFSNTDFIGPAVVVDEPGSGAFSNYEMRVRMGAADNDGYGVLVRVQDDNNFYRINFANEAADAAGVTRAPRGLSVQKVRNGVWTQLFTEGDQANPLFAPPVNGAGTRPDSPGFQTFDLTVGAVGNTLKIQVRDQNGNVISYPLITDNSDPLLTGTVGLATWGTDNVYYQGYGGQQEAPLLSALPAFTGFNVTVDRATGNLTLTNNGAAPENIKGVTIFSAGGGLNPAGWTSIADLYDEPPGNGSVDPDDPWTEISSSEFELSEAEQSGGNGGTLAVGQSVNLGSAWRKSRIEDVFVLVELGGAGGLANAPVAFSGTPIARSDLNADGMVNAADWPLFYPNLLADLSSLSAVNRALAGDLDGDGDNDVNDFSLFKADFDAANGAGAFQALLASVPEPSTLAMLVIVPIAALLGRWRRAPRILTVVATVMTLIALAPRSASAVPVDLTTFTVEAFPAAAGFPVPTWVLTPTTATLNNNGDASVLFSPGSALNKRFVGSLTPGTDDDVVGFVLGFEPGDTQIGSSGDYLVIDWKGANQTFNFEDGDVLNFYHSATPGGPMPVGLALSRITGSPTADELWQHTDLPENPTGSVEQLARGTTLGSAAYNRSNGSHLFDIRYSSTNVTVLVDGVEQFNVNGSFPDGRFGLYSAWQGPQPTFSNFEELSIDFAGLSAQVDRSNGNITLRNAGSTPVEFDYYQFDSASNSLNTSGWNSLSDQNFQSVGGGAHQKWQEAGGSDASALGEAYLAGMSTLAGNGSVSIGNAYNNLVNGEDLTLTFRLPSGLVLQGAVEYIGMPPVGLMGDYNQNGTVDAADYVVWRKTDGSPAGYNTWRTNFGRTAGGGAALAGAASVPEPASAVLILGAVLLGLPRRIRIITQRR